jgi:hypothetical protein
MSLTVLVGVMVVGGIFITYILPDVMDEGFQIALYIMLLLLSGTIFSSTIFSDLGDRQKSIGALTLPATHLEKYLVAWLYAVVVFLLVYTGSFYVILHLIVLLKHPPVQTMQFSSLLSNKQSLIMLMVYIVLQSIAFYGAIFFKKMHFIKTAFIFFLSIVLLTIINKTMLSIMTRRAVNISAPFVNFRFKENNREIVLQLLDHQDIQFVYFFLALIIILWAAAYHRLREKQV